MSDQERDRKISALTEKLSGERLQVAQWVLRNSWNSGAVFAEDSEHSHYLGYWTDGQPHLEFEPGEDFTIRGKPERPIGTVVKDHIFPNGKRRMRRRRGYQIQPPGSPISVNQQPPPNRTLEGM